MAKKNCPDGSRWDSLIKLCFSTNIKPKPTTERPLSAAVERTNTTPPPQSPALWICVSMVTLGSMLALAVWFIIYRRYTRPRGASVEAGPAQQPLQKTEKEYPLPVESNGQAEGAAGASSLCRHLHLGVQTGFKSEEGFTACRDPLKHVGRGGSEGLPTCSAVREHTIPLPATELGGTALVTTKTV